MDQNSRDGEHVDTAIDHGTGSLCPIRVLANLIGLAMPSPA
jgi:hypothetical protein